MMIFQDPTRSRSSLSKQRPPHTPNGCKKKCKGRCEHNDESRQVMNHVQPQSKGEASHRDHIITLFFPVSNNYERICALHARVFMSCFSRDARDDLALRPLVVLPVRHILCSHELHRFPCFALPRKCRFSVCMIPVLLRGR